MNRLRTTAPDSAGGFDARDQTAGWVTAPPETGAGWRKLTFVPEPATVALLAFGGLGTLLARWKRKVHGR